MELNKKINYYRKLNDLTMAELANALGMSIGAVQKYENGTVNPSIVVLEKLSTIFNISLATLLEDEKSLTPTEIIVRDLIDLTNKNKLEWQKVTSGINKNLFNKKRVRNMAFEIADWSNFEPTDENNVSENYYVDLIENALLSYGYFVEVNTTFYCIYRTEERSILYNNYMMYLFAFRFKSDKNFEHITYSQFINDSDHDRLVFKLFTDITLEDTFPHDISTLISDLKKLKNDEENDNSVND